MIVARFKAATGLSDREIGQLLGVARSTVQGAVTGQQTMRLTDDAKALMAVSCLNRIETLKQLHKDLGQ